MADQNPPPSEENPLFHKATIYAGDLDPEVTEEDLREAFRFMGPVASVRLCRDSLTGDSLRYAYINFYSFSHASKALACLNHTELKGKPMRLMWSQRDPLLRKNGSANVFVKNLDASITSAQLQDMFEKFGNILSCKVAKEEYGSSKGFGFVHFDSEESAENAIKSLHDTEVHGKKLFVSKFVKKSERMAAFNEEMKYTNLFVRNIDVDITEDLLHDIFARFGEVSSVAIIKNEMGNSKGFGFVKFISPDAAKKAVMFLNGSLLGSKLLSVERARQKDGKRTTLNDQHENLKISNLRVKNLDVSVDNKQLRQHFGSCGKVVSVRVIRLKNGLSKGVGFVCFSTNEEAKKALRSLNGTILAGKPLLLEFARNEYNNQKDKPASQDHHIASSQPLHDPFPYRSLDNSYFVQYPPLLQNILLHYIKTLRTGQVQMGNTAFPN